jgi:hypothetical protein
VSGPGGLGEPAEQGLRYPVGVVAGLQQVRRDRGDEHALGHPRRAVAAQVAGDLPGAHRVPDKYGVAQVEVFEQGIEVGGEGVVVIPGCRLTGLAEPPPVVGDDPVPGVKQDLDLLVPGAAAERVTVDQHDGLAGAVVLVVDLDVGVVLLADADCGHGASFRWLDGRRPRVRGAGPVDLRGGTRLSVALRPGPSRPW